MPHKTRIEDGYDATQNMHEDVIGQNRENSSATSKEERQQHNNTGVHGTYSNNEAHSDSSLMTWLLKECEAYEEPNNDPSLVTWFLKEYYMGDTAFKTIKNDDILDVTDAAGHILPKTTTTARSVNVIVDVTDNNGVIEDENIGDNTMITKEDDSTVAASVTEDEIPYGDDYDENPDNE